MKTTIRKQLFLLLTALFVGAIPANAQSLIRGDVNGDGEVTIADVTALVNYLHTGEFNMIARTLAFAENTTAVTKSYGDANFTIAATPDRGAEEGTITYASSETGVATINEIIGEVTIEGVGETTITASITAGTNYAAAEASYTLTVNAAAISLTVTLEDWTYGSPNSPSVSGNTGNGTVTYYYKTGDGEWTETQPTDAGTHQVKASVAANGNYAAGETAAVEFTIAKADPTYTAPVYTALTYTGEAQNLVSAGSSEHGTFTYSDAESGTYSETIPQGTNAGNYTVWYKFTGDANHNDVAATQVEGVSIGKASNSFTAQPTISGWTAGEEANAPTGGVATFGTIVYKYCGSSDGEYGTYDAIVNGAVGTWYVKGFVEGTDNYEAAESNAVEFTIAKATASVTTAPAAVSGTLVANGSAQALVTAGEATGGTLKYYVSTTNSAPTTETGGWTTTVSTGTDADTYYVWYYVEGDANHNSTAVTAIYGESKTIYPAPEVVDLGLSVKWANMNIGATSVTDYGLYFVWGETVGRAGTNTSGTANDGYSYDWSNYAWSNGAYNTLTKYVPTDKTSWNASGSHDNKTTL